MNLQFRKLLTAGLLALVAVSTPALSQDTGWYAGIGLGQSKTFPDCTGTTACDDTDTAWKIFGGYQVNTNFGVELGYTTLGETTATFAGIPVSLKAKGFELPGVGTLPINQQFSVYGKLGFFRWDLDASALGLSITESGTDVTWGFGVKYNFTKNVAMRAYYQRYTDIGNDATTGMSDVDVIGVAVVLRF